MKSQTLKPHSDKKERYALKAFLWGEAIIALFVVPCMIMDKGMFLYFGDYNGQVLPFYQTMSSAIRSGNFGWNWYTDLGVSLVGGYSFYNLGSPFFWLMVPFPVEAIPYLMGPLTILKFGLASMFAYIFLKRYTKNKNNAVIGGVLYAFSGFAIYSMVFQFEDALVFFPLLIAAMESFIYDQKRGRFALMVALCALVNFYFFVAEAVFLIIYWIVRMATKSFKMVSKDVIYLIFEAVLGVGLSLFILLPSIYHMLGNNRVSNSTAMNGWTYWAYENVYMYFQILISMFMPPEIAKSDIYVTGYKSTWASITGYLPLFSMAGVFAIIFNKRRNKWLRVFYAICGLLMFVPVFNSAFQMFTEVKYLRWFFMLVLIMSLGSVIALEDPATKWKKAITANFVAVVLITAILGFTPYKFADGVNLNVVIGIAGTSYQFWIYVAVALLNIIMCIYIVRLSKTNKTALKRYGALIISVAIVSTLASTFVPAKKIGDEKLNLINTNALNHRGDLDIDDIQNWRTDIVSNSTYSSIMWDEDHLESIDFAELEQQNAELIVQIMNDDNSNVYEFDENLNMFWEIPGTESFHSTVSGSVMDFFNGLGYDRETVTSWPTGMYGLRSLMSVKYLVNHEDNSFRFENENGEYIMYGWKHLDNQLGYDIYENEYVLPMGFTFDKFITASEFSEIPLQYKHLALMEAMVVNTIDDMFLCAAAGMEQVTAKDFEFTEEAYIKNYNDRMKLTCYNFERDTKGFEAKISTGDSEEYVFFSVPFDNGWSAEVNGEKADIMVADYGFMAVLVPANQESTIRFNYHTPGFRYGLFVAGVCLFLLLLYAAAMKMQSMPVAEDENGGSDNNNPNGGSDKPDKPTDGGSDTYENSENPENAENKPNDNSKADFMDEDITLFDIVKETEEQNMMNVYGRVQVALESGYGSTAYDIEGKKYIDFTAGIGVNALGYADGGWNDAVEKQLMTVQHISNLYYNTTQIQLAELLCQKTGFSKVFFANSGAEANECAIKIARKYGSDKYGKEHTHIVTLENSFHGRTITTLSATGQDVFHQYFYPFTEGFSFAKANDIESIKENVTENTCAVMIELIQGEGGVNPLDKEFVSQLAEYCTENDLLLIVDEIQTGIGRTGKLFCYENFGITPDVITSAKALSGGLPLSACLCNEKLKDVMTIGTNGTTFGGNPIACAGALRIIDVVSDEQFLKEVRVKGKYMRKRIKSMKGVKEVRGMGLMIGIVLEKDNAKEVLAKCAENGLLVLTAKNLIRLLPPLNIDFYDIDEGLDILENTILETLDEDKA